MAEQLNIRRLIDRISSGDIRIPAFQRGFVWDSEQTAFLLDSIYKGFPIGTVILWRTGERLTVEKQVGAFELREPSKDYPVNYVLDGQQRLTTLFSAFQTELAPISDEWTEIYFDMAVEENIQESSFLALEAAEVDVSRHFPVKSLFDTVAYRKATDDLTPEKIKIIDDLQARFKEYQIPNETFESSDRNKVAIVFERINRAGTALNIFELLAAWSWSEDFDLVDKFNDLQDKIASHGYDDLVSDRDLQLRICSAVITGRTSPKNILDLRGEDIRVRFSEIENGIIGAIDFLKRELKMSHFKLLPFPGVLVPLSCFFATSANDGRNYDIEQKNAILKWFWRTILSRRYSSDVNERQANDISEMVALKSNPKHDFRLPKAEIKIDFERGNFAPGGANSKSFIAMLNSQSPKSFLSGALVNTATVLKKGSKHEYHHIFPVAFLEKLGFDKKRINVLANICFLTRSDNTAISDRSPGDYLDGIDTDARSDLLNLALCPQNTIDLNFDEFRNQRNEILVREANRLMGS